MLELVMFIRFMNSDKNEVIEQMSDTYTEKTLGEFNEVFENLKYTIGELNSLGAFSSGVQEIYIELQLHSEENDDITVLEQFSIS